MTEMNEKMMCGTKGKVWLVGAGPGDPGLFTLKGKQVLAQAEVVVYDALVGQGIMHRIPDGAEKINVGKRASHHTMKQEDINEILLKKALEGKRVVRLKGGDPFLFGRGGEELELLHQHGVPFEIVPGVPSAISVPAYQGIPVTHRDFCSSVHIITGHKRAGVFYNIDFEALVHTKGTLVFLMGVTALGDICRGLLEAGMDADTPAALLMQGTTAHQERIVATVATLEQAVLEKGAKTPAVIVIGKVCDLSEKFSWVEKLPLGGVRVLLTRPAGQIGETADRLRALGAEVWECPAIRTVKRKNHTVLMDALKKMESYQWLVFTSPTGVRIFFEELHSLKFDLRKLGDVKIACIGDGSARELETHGMYPDLVPDVFDGAHLGAALAQASTPGMRILIPRAAIGNRELVDALAGRIVDDIPIYDTIYEKNMFADCRGVPERGMIDYALFTSASGVRGFAAAMDAACADNAAFSGVPAEDTVRDLSWIRAICIGRQTAQAAKEFGMQTWIAKQASMESLVECLLDVVGHEIKITEPPRNGSHII